MEFYRPVLAAMREMFGPERLIYASNWPVSSRFAPLATVQGRAAEERVFNLSSKTAYRWSQRAKSEP